MNKASGCVQLCGNGPNKKQAKTVAEQGKACL